MNKSIIYNKFFLSGLLIKLIFITFLIPKIHIELFMPFLLDWLNNPNLIIWDKELISNNTSPFPYGLVMFLIFLPLTFIFYIMNNILDLNNLLFLTNLGLKFTLLLFDFFVLLILIKIFSKIKKEIILYYWLSPLVIFITYWHGQLDIIPVSLLLTSLFYLKNQSLNKSMIIIGLSIVAKHSMIICIPFVLIYLIKQKLDTNRIIKLMLYLALTIIIFELPFLFNEGYQLLVINNQEIEKLYSMNIEMGEGNFVYFVPLIYLLLLYYFQRLRRINFELLFAGMSVAFSILIFLTPSSPGWIIWIIPILIIHQINYGFKASILILVFSILFIFYNFFKTSGSIFLNSFDIKLLFTSFDYNKYLFINYTLVITSGLIISAQILRSGIKFNDYYKFNIKPVSIGISGDSSTGKTTLSNALKNIFGDKFTQEILGDDYHNWERASNNWKKQTHLNPKSNNLLKLTNDLREMINGNSIYSKKYDHKTGKFQIPKIKDSSDFIIVNGLHTLFSKQLRDLFNIKIFMEMNSELKIKLKTYRDHNLRKKDLVEIRKSIASRFEDYKNYIHPQKDLANIVFYLDLDDISSLKDKEIKDNKLKLKLNVSIKNCLYYQELHKVLNNISELKIRITDIDSDSNVNFEINGQASIKDITNSSKILIPQVDEILNVNAKFSSGITGVMQLIILIELVETLKRRYF
tara:strand:- start:1288 stop:3360 length:2073 start_codon:yes stop_codon:yes gene_type:complete